MTELRKRGLATAVICSEPFLKLGKAQSRVFGVPDMPFIVIPHPLGGLALGDVKARAEVALSQVVKLIEELRK
jgi:hypothetical protein